MSLRRSQKLLFDIDQSVKLSTNSPIAENRVKSPVILLILIIGFCARRPNASSSSHKSISF